MATGPPNQDKLSFFCISYLGTWYVLSPSQTTVMNGQRFWGKNNMKAHIEYNMNEERNFSRASTSQHPKKFRQVIPSETSADLHHNTIESAT